MFQGIANVLFSSSIINNTFSELICCLGKVLHYIYFLQFFAIVFYKKLLQCKFIIPSVLKPGMPYCSHAFVALVTEFGQHQP